VLIYSIYAHVDFALGNVLSVVFSLLGLVSFGRMLTCRFGGAPARQLSAHGAETLALLLQKGCISAGFLLAHRVLQPPRTVEGFAF
jgi:hypothetical protein